MTQPLRESDPILAAAESAPLVPLTAEEEELLAKARATPGDWVPHDELVRRVAVHPDDSSE